MNRRQLLLRTASFGLASIAASGIIRIGGAMIAPAKASTGTDMIYPQALNRGVALGAYDPHGDFSAYQGVTIEHLFLPWQDVELSSLYAADSYALARGRSLLITIEPWSWSGDWKLTPKQLRDDVLGGRYDDTIASMASIISKLKSQVTLRWGQEMEDTSGRFSWGGWNPNDYIEGFKRFHRIAGQNAPNAKFMWSPKGDKNLADYYPGDDYVDVIGLSIFGLQKYDREKFGRDRSFAEHLSPGYEAASRFGKKIVVAELGYSGDEGYVKNWAGSVTAHYPQFPLLVAVVYFNDKEVRAWPEAFGLPNWRIGSSVTV
jgi:beta-mannanase